jgi:hypothetical protein
MTHLTGLSLSPASSSARMNIGDMTWNIGFGNQQDRFAGQNDAVSPEGR